MKKCSKCEIKKDESEFHKDKHNKDGLCYKCKECFKLHYQKNKEKILKQSKEYRIQNKEKVSERGKKHYIKNKEEIDRKHREYDHKTRTKRKKIKKKYRNQKYHGDACFRLRINLSDKIRRTLLNNNGSKQGYSILKKLPYSMQELKQHIESLWESWMSWDNYGRANLNKRTWQIDHIIPHSNFHYDNMDCEDFKKCWVLSNLRPLEAFENIKKGNKI